MSRSGDGVLIGVRCESASDARELALGLIRSAIGAGIVLAELAVRRPDLGRHYLSRVEGSAR